MKLTQFIQTQPLVVSTIMVAAVVAIMWLSVREVLVGRLDTGTVFMYWGLLVNLMNPMNRVAAFFGDISKAVVGAGRVFELLDLPVEDARRRRRRCDRLDARAHRVQRRHVFAISRRDPPALCRRQRDDRGRRNRRAGRPLGRRQDDVRQSRSALLSTATGQRAHRRRRHRGRCVSPICAAQIAIVPQDAQLFRGHRSWRTFATAVWTRPTTKYARPPAKPTSTTTCGTSREATLRKSANAGVRPSGGERQRIAIARAVLRDPRILILDEATSALDSHSEAMIEEALDRLLPGRTTMIIAHRLSTVRRANRVLYFEAGRVIEVGTHAELISRGGAYARLHAAQFATGAAGSAG